jgi:hypothetical protein
MTATQNHDHSFPFHPFLQVLFAFLGVVLWLVPATGFAQEVAQEVAVNLAEGRVVICAAKDGIIVATVDVHSEPGSRPPAVVPLSPFRAGVMLGAVEWVQPESPESKDKPIRLDREFRGLAAAAMRTSGRQDYSTTATDIEAIGVAVLERVRQVAEVLHHKINLGEDEPLIRLVLAGYVRDYGPEAWTVDYHIHQDSLGNDYWRTRVLRPRYNQLYPPVKGQPHTLMEVRYPPANRAQETPELLDLLRQNDPRLANLRAADERLEKSVTLVVDGRSQKSSAASDIQFLKAALLAVFPPKTKITMAQVDFDEGFQRILQPPEPAPAPSAPNDQTPQEPERPTLRRKPGR